MITKVLWEDNKNFIKPISSIRLVISIKFLIREYYSIEERVFHSRFIYRQKKLGFNRINNIVDVAIVIVVVVVVLFIGK